MNKTIRLSSVAMICAVAFVFTQCKNNKSKEAVFIDPLPSHIDSTYMASQDFFMYANNGWFKANPIPASENGNGIFRTIQDTINNQIKSVCESSAAKTDVAKGSNEQKIGDFYFSGMDTVAIEKAGITPLNDELKRIDGVSDLNSMVAQLAHMYRIGAGCPFGFYVNMDDKNSAQYAVFLSQGGLGLPERDYYFKNDARTANIRTEYVKHITAMFKLMGNDDATATAAANKIMSLETDLATSSRTMADRRDPYKNYNKMAVDAVTKLNPSIVYANFLNELGLKNVDSVVVGQPEFFSGLEKYFKKYSLADWKTYMKWNLINSFAGYLSKPFDDQNFAFYGTILSGTKEQKPRWKRVVEQTDGSLGELIGQVYVKDYLPAGSKEKLLEIGNNIRNVYAEHIKKLDWMSDSTKVKALSKLDKIVMKVGYPDKWKDMSNLTIDRGAYVLNVMHANEWEFNFMLSHYGKPVDRTEWDMYPQTYNAYYNPSNNEIVVPACNILVPGFEGRMPDDAILYGIIGGST
ncbi:MAG: M13 family metallopeptidase, partial [Bacteroidia bacterium]